MEGKSRLLAVFLVALTVVAACDRGSKQPDLSLLGPSSLATSTVLTVGSLQCPKGGIRIDSGIDANNNGILDSQEVVSSSPICNDLANSKKPNGYGSLIKIESEPTGSAHCAAGGLKVLSGTDVNKNGVLDSSEIAYTEYVCNGAPGSSRAAGITVEVGQPVVPALKDNEKKKSASSPSKVTPAAPDAPAKTPKNVKVKAAPKPAAEERTAPVEQPIAPPKKDSAKVTPPAPAAEEQAAPVESAAPAKKTGGKVKPSASTPAKSVSAAPAAPQGWISVKVQSPQLARVEYKLDGRSIIVRFTNLSETSPVRFKYTVRWKEGQNGKLVDDSTMEGISFRLKPLESLEREVRTNAAEPKDVVVDLDVSETTLSSISPELNQQNES